MISLSGLLFDASSFVSSNFKIQLEKSQLKPYSPENWQRFCQANGFDANSGGLYIPKSYSAYVNADSPVLVSNAFHEFFGHGLFCEHSLIGQELVEIENSNSDVNSFLYDEIDSRTQPLTLTKRNIGNYEGFALWLEALLCEETENDKIWITKRDSLPEIYNGLFEYFRDAEQKLTRFGFMAQLGFPKYYDEGTLINVLKHLYGSKLGNIDFIVLYGSQKPYSDIDLFVISSNPSYNYFNGWLDVYELNRGEFQHLADNLNIGVTDPLFSGNLIHGDSNYFEQLKQKILNQPITQEAIEHNLQRAELQRGYLPQFSEMPRERKACLAYIESYTKNAEELKKGRKVLTLQNIN